MPAESFRSAWLPRRELRRHVAALWAARTADDDPLLPDAAVELVWSGRGLFVRGADTRAHSTGSFPEQTFVAVRFRPRAAVHVLGLRGRDLADARVGISELWGRDTMERLEHSLSSAQSPRAAADILEAAVHRHLHVDPDAVVEATVGAIHHARSDVRIRTLADEIGLSERQLLRRCTDALGYGPKTLQRIFRFQRFRSLRRADPISGSPH